MKRMMISIIQAPKGSTYYRKKSNSLHPPDVDRTSLAMFDPQRYESYKSAAARDAALFVPQLVSQMTWGQKELILDYGCGAGSTGNKFILPMVEKHDSRIHSVDISPDMIAHAKKTYRHERVTFEAGDILQESFPHRDVQFDKIFAVYVLHFVQDYKEALKRFYDILKPGGYLGFTVLTRSTLYTLHEKLGTNNKWSSYMEGYKNYIPEWIQQKQKAEVAFRVRLEEIGYEVVQLCPHHQEFVFDSINTLAELYLSLNPFIKVIPSELHNDVKTEYSDFLREHWKVGPEEEGITTNYELLYGLVRKPILQ